MRRNFPSAISCDSLVSPARSLARITRYKISAMKQIAACARMPWGKRWYNGPISISDLCTLKTRSMSASELQPSNTSAGCYPALVYQATGLGRNRPDKAHHLTGHRHAHFFLHLPKLSIFFWYRSHSLFCPSHPMDCSRSLVFSALISIVRLLLAGSREFPAASTEVDPEFGTGV